MTKTPFDETISTPMVEALETAWATIRARNADVPPAVVILGAGSIGAPKGMLRLGHFASSRWRQVEDGAAHAEISIGGEGPSRGPAPDRRSADRGRVLAPARSSAPLTALPERGGHRPRPRHDRHARPIP
jgi:hypothetical protein